MGAIIASRIAKHLKDIFKDLERIILWSDSTIALNWIKGSAFNYKPFVSNRAIEIQEITDPSNWRHCSGKQNPADMLTRGIGSKDLITSESWWHGPEWLRNAENPWPKAKGFQNDSIEPEIASEFKPGFIISTAIVQEKIIDPKNSLDVNKKVEVWHTFNREGIGPVLYITAWNFSSSPFFRSLIIAQLQLHLFENVSTLNCFIRYVHVMYFYNPLLSYGHCDDEV
ncbi:hypothetical protein HNY73_010133 [Argiope bruennichi]|uniref:Uncharacterized protein n=1 Tax=Argiope bruennichi TaxID=94029 RepID=A0A8T0F2D8_ARGBR|nr:hypothetical protein HNY73_010133 [Argiope bruennichi]